MSLGYYRDHAAELMARYRNVTFDDVHAGWRDLVPQRTAVVLDVGAGSGRDADWFARRGHEVVAVEPCGALRALAEKTTPPGVCWLDDSLPGLEATHRLGLRFDIILVSAV